MNGAKALYPCSFPYILLIMKEKINTYLHYLSFVAVIGFAAWYYLGDVRPNQMFTLLIFTIVLIEIISFVLVGKKYPESHTHFKIVLVVTLIILLGVKQMAPSFFPGLTVATLAVNFVYNFYASAKREKGAFKRRNRRKLQL